jgi:sec-independent protein translocase protein TatC
MTVAAPPPPPTKHKFDPDEYRMTIGEHLEELRRRMIIALVGWGVMLVVCFLLGDQVLLVFCRPLFNVLDAKHLNTQIYYDELGEGFLVWIEVNLITATALASPWIVYQLWLFVAAGLYPHERKYVTKYAPMSIGLLIGGMLFVYFLVLPWSIVFFLDFAGSVPIPRHGVTTTQPYTPFVAPKLHGDPVNPPDGALWFDEISGRLRFAIDGTIRSVNFNAENLLAPHIKLADYVDLVTGMLLTFGLSFQLPLVVLALVRIGIVEIEQLKAFRRYVYFAISILAAAITPGDVITATILLMIPLIFLYELGIWLARVRPAAQRGAEAT